MDPRPLRLWPETMAHYCIGDSEAAGHINEIMSDCWDMANEEYPKLDMEEEMAKKNPVPGVKHMIARAHMYEICVSQKMEWVQDEEINYEQIELDMENTPHGDELMEKEVVGMCKAEADDVLEETNSADLFNCRITDNAEEEEKEMEKEDLEQLAAMMEEKGVMRNLDLTALMRQKKKGKDKKNGKDKAKNNNAKRASAKASKAFKELVRDEKFMKQMRDLHFFRCVHARFDMVCEKNLNELVNGLAVVQKKPEILGEIMEELQGVIGGPISGLPQFPEIAKIPKLPINPPKFTINLPNF